MDKNTIIKKGTLLEINHTRKGKFVGIATEDFKLSDEWYPVAAIANKDGAPSAVRGLNPDNVWIAGDEIPCRGTFCKLKILKI